MQLSGRNRFLGEHFAPFHVSSPPQDCSTVCCSVYTSIERCKMTPSGDIEWIMATASDAKGNLPMAAQKLGVPGAIVNDVGFFMKWTADNRSSAGAS